MVQARPNPRVTLVVFLSLWTALLLLILSLWFVPGGWRVMYPLLLIFTCFTLIVIPLALWSFRTQISQWRKKNGCCLVCGYDLRSTPERCPECGTPTTGRDDLVVVAPFTARHAAIFENADLILARLSSENPKHYVSFQCSLPVEMDEWGVYVEYDDPSNAGHGLIAKCVLTRETLSIDLNQTVGRGPRYSGIAIRLNLDDSDWYSFARGLQRVFGGSTEVLSIVPEIGVASPG